MPQRLASTVYFDNAATTAVLPCALERLNDLSAKVMGNSSSAHRLGRQAQEVLDRCHESLGRHFDVPPTHVIFTSGGSESNNLAIWGALGGLSQAFKWLKSGGQGKIITSTIEHPATGKVAEALHEMGAPVSWIKVNSEGLLDLTQLESELSARTRIVSFHHVQNEVGVLQDIPAVTRLVRARQPDALIHIDAVQSFMKVPLKLETLGVDMVSVSAHKVGGPKGIGALILGRRFENRNPKLGSLLLGASQQHGLRAGTVPVPTIGAFIAAVEWGAANLVTNSQRLVELRQRLLSKLPSQALVNGPADLSPTSPRRAPQTVSFAIPKLPSAVAVEALSERGYCVSAGSACHSTNPRPNETLMAMGLGRDRALSSIRVSFCVDNTFDEIDGFSATLNEIIQQYT